jgi:hypothetical protein
MGIKWINRDDNDFALAWVKSYGKGRIFYTSFGHRTELYWNPELLKFYLDAIQFVTGDLDAPTEPRSDRPVKRVPGPAPPEVRAAKMKAKNVPTPTEQEIQQIEAAALLRIYIVTDLEGASGVYQFAQTREPDNPLCEKAKEYLMGDIAAVVRGLRAANVTEIVVLDGHGSQAFVPHLMEPGAKYITGKPRPGPTGRPLYDGHARRLAGPYTVVKNGKSILVQRGRVWRVGSVCGHRRALWRPDHHGDWR